MPAALIAACVDPRLNHELIRIQVRQKLDLMGLRADRIFLLNEVAANTGTTARATAQFIRQIGDSVILAAVLYHDDCLAEQAGLRADLDATARALSAELARLDVRCPIITGQVLTVNNLVVWSDAPTHRYFPFTFGHG